MKNQKYMVGAMIEIPRAALTADKVAQEAEFFSSGGLPGPEDLRQRPVRRPRPGRRGAIGEDGRGTGPQDPSRPGNRHLRRARRRTQLGAVLLPRGHELRLLFPLTACRSPVWPPRRPPFQAINPNPCAPR